MITVRDDDVLVPSSSHLGKEEARFRRVHEVIVAAGALHVPTILCGEIQKFPDTIEYIKDEISHYRMAPQLHGWLHDPYHKMTPAEVDADLGRCVEWFAKTFGYTPAVWYTPWGADTPDLQHAASKHDMELIGVDGIIPPTHIRRNEEQFRGNQNIEVFIHWWEGINRLIDSMRILNDTK